MNEVHCNISGATSPYIAFNNEGADVYVFYNDKRGTEDSTKISVCICKGDDMLSFSAGESYNSADTAFTSVNIRGLPMKERQNPNGDPSEGIYPYSITPNSSRIKGQELYERAVEIINREVPKFGEVIKRYIPKSPVEIKQDFRDAVSTENQKRSDQEQAKRILEWNNRLDRF